MRNRADISEQTRDRILTRMKQMNCRPNLAARALVTGRTSSIGLVVPGSGSSLLRSSCHGYFQGLRSRGYCLIISCSEEDPELEQRESEQLLTRRVDTLIIASAQWT